MNKIRNKVQLIGHLGQDPEIKEFDNGKLCRMSLATNETYKNRDGEKVTDTQWHNLIAWNKLADVAQEHLKKGMEVAIEGKLTNRAYEDRDGIKRYASEVVVGEFLRLGKPVS